MIINATDSVPLPALSTVVRSVTWYWKIVLQTVKELFTRMRPKLICKESDPLHASLSLKTNCWMHFDNMCPMANPLILVCRFQVLAAISKSDGSSCNHRAIIQGLPCEHTDWHVQNVQERVALGDKSMSHDLLLLRLGTLVYQRIVKRELASS